MKRTANLTCLRMSLRRNRNMKHSKMLILCVCFIAGISAAAGFYFGFPNFLSFDSTKYETIATAWKHQKTAIESPFDKVEVRRDIPSVLVVAYMRSGSTFAAEALRHGEGAAFFSFEPLWEIFRDGVILPGRICKRNNMCSYPDMFLRNEASTLRILKDIFACNIANLPDAVLRSFPKFTQNNVHLSIQNCFPTKKSLKKKNKKWNAKKQERRERMRRHCIELLESKCQSASSIIVKTIRVSMTLLEDLITKIPSLKIVHLIREPRGIISSRLNMGEINAFGIIPSSMQLCTRMHRDILFARSLSDSYPTRIIPLMYECLSQKPQIVLRHLYEKLSFKFTEKTEKWINEFTNSSKENQERSTTISITTTHEYDTDMYDEDSDQSKGINTGSDDVELQTTLSSNNSIQNRPRGFSVHRTNSLERSMSWRKTLSRSTASVIDSQCFELYEELNIMSFETESDMLNLTIKSYGDNFYMDTYCQQLWTPNLKY